MEEEVKVQRGKRIERKKRGRKHTGGRVIAE